MLARTQSVHLLQLCRCLPVFALLTCRRCAVQFKYENKVDDTNANAHAQCEAFTYADSIVSAANGQAHASASRRALQLPNASCCRQR